MTTFFIYYFVGAVLTLVIGILLMKYCEGIVENKRDLSTGSEILIVLSLFSWIAIIALIVTLIIYGLKQLIYNKLGDWILKDK